MTASLMGTAESDHPLLRQVCWPAAFRVNSQAASNLAAVSTPDGGVSVGQAADGSERLLGCSELDLWLLSTLNSSLGLTTRVWL